MMPSIKENSQLKRLACNNGYDSHTVDKLVEKLLKQLIKSKTDDESSGQESFPLLNSLTVGLYTRNLVGS